MSMSERSADWWIEWESKNRGWSKRNVLKRHRILTHLARLSGFCQKSRALSVACGTGYYDLGIQSLVKELVCVDVASQAVNISKERDLDVVRAEVRHLPFKSDTFDCTYALSLSTIGCKTGTDRMRVASISEMKRVTRGAGKVVIGHRLTVWNKLYWLVRYGSFKHDFFCDVSLSQVKNAFKQNDLKLCGLIAILPLPYFVLRRINYMLVDRVLSELSFHNFGEFLVIAGIKLA